MIQLRFPADHFKGGLVQPGENGLTEVVLLFSDADEANKVLQQFGKIIAQAQAAEKAKTAPPPVPEPIPEPVPEPLAEEPHRGRSPGRRR